MPSPETLRVCIGFTPLTAPHYLERLRSIPGVEPVVLPIDPGGDWLSVSPGEPHSEPPPWAKTVAREREAALASAHVLMALHTPDRLSERAPGLRWVQGAGAGVEQFGKAGIAKDRVVLTNCSGLSSGSMAEWVIGRLLQVWKRLREADEFQRAHRFERSYGRTFAGSTIGIVGLGHIGRAVAVRARAFGCRILGSRRTVRPGDTDPDVDQLYPTAGLHEMLALCDAVVVAAPATADTYHLIDRKALAAMPRRAVLVNVARGSLVDEAELARVMQEEPLAAAILDVFDPEPLDPASPLWDIPNVFISAHSSVSVDRYMDDVFELFFDNVKRFRAGEPLRNQVDMKAVGFE
ncbi:MAG: D-2-hydroxyacid dehydrogenase [Deltaproteobacteria bacterium]|nr:D-2-hydroxyacid dehydrogenase [Deltaproteobacteria bacterium]